uniref:Uncharacterized protein n=1 Tax=Poecilia latipinna TaxID=48699 RepID=A0A3B3UAK4_9TELE
MLALSKGGPAFSPSHPLLPLRQRPSSDSTPDADGFYLEPLMPAVLKTAKEKSVCLNKEEESGEGPRSAGRGSLRRGDGSSAAVRRKAPSDLNQTFPAPGEEERLTDERQQADFRAVITREPAEGFYLTRTLPSQSASTVRRQSWRTWMRKRRIWTKL